LIGKLIILGIIVVALVVFVPGISKIFSPSNIKTLEQRIDNATSDKPDNSTVASPSQQTNSTTPVSLYQLDPKYIDKQTYTGQVFSKTGNTCQISVPDMAQTVNSQMELTHIIEIGQCSYNVGQPVQVTSLAAKPNAPQPVSPSNAIQIVPYADPSQNSPTYVNTGGPGVSASATGYPTLPPYYQTINLNAQNKGNDVVMSYDDTSEKTTSVTVTLRNSDGQIFTGTFTTSQFQTEIKDVPDTPHIIDMTVVNSDYGTLHGSVYAPSNIQNSTINGILTGP
jgi:hypothetical protein